MRPILVLMLALVTTIAMRAENFVFETNSARLIIGSNGTAVGLIEKQKGADLLNPQGRPLAVVRKSGDLVSSSAIERRGDLFHITFGNSGVSADYRITGSTDYILFELAAIHGEGIDEIRIIQLSTSLVNSGNWLGVRWNDDFAVCLIGLNQDVSYESSGPISSASVHAKFSMVGRRVAVIAVSTTRFLDAIQKTEHDFNLPSPTIAGTWAKRSTDVRTSYLFTDLTEADADEMIRDAKLGGFRYILIYSGTWSDSLGSYPINLKNFPHGEAGLKAVIDKCHASGLKVGMHILVDYIQKNDPYAQPKPNLGLQKDAKATLASNLNENTTELAANFTLAQFSSHANSYDFVIDDEIIRCSRMAEAKLSQCQRGIGGTKAGTHSEGAKIERLAVQSGSYYVADPGSSLEKAISERVAGVINRAGFDMIYLDGGVVNSVDKPLWYWASVQPQQIVESSKRDLLVEGSGLSPWGWHIVSRGTCDDYAAVAVKQYLDYHKIADSWRKYHDSFLPAELGWVGFLQDTPDHPATTPDELEYHAVRMLALNSAVSIETSLSALKANGRALEMLKLLGEYEQLRLSGAVPKETLELLRHGEWHMISPGKFAPVQYATQRVEVPTNVTIKNEYGEQPLKFKLQTVSKLATVGAVTNIALLHGQTPLDLPSPGAQAAMPGALVQRVELSNTTQNQSSVFIVGASDRSQGGVLNLTSHRALAVQVDVEGPMSAPSEIPVLNVQLEAAGNTFRDYYIDLDFRGSKTVILPEPGTDRMLAEFRPAAANYPFKAAMYSFNYGNITALNFRWMRFSKNAGIRCRIGRVEALEERGSSLKDIEISIGSAKVSIPGELKVGDYAEYWAEGWIRVFDRNGVLLRTVAANQSPMLGAGENKLAVKASGIGDIKLTAITLGK